MLEATLIFAIITYVLMLAAYKLHSMRKFHMPIMASVIVIDLLFPIYLVLNKDWYRRLIEQEEILSFMIWMHFILVLTLYALYVLQVMTARKMLKGEMDVEEVRHEHRVQGKGILIARGLVILSAAMLIEPGQTE